MASCDSPDSLAHPAGHISNYFDDKEFHIYKQLYHRTPHFSLLGPTIAWAALGPETRVKVRVQRPRLIWILRYKAEGEAGKASVIAQILKALERSSQEHGTDEYVNAISDHQNIFYPRDAASTLPVIYLIWNDQPYLFACPLEVGSIRGFFIQHQMSEETRSVMVTTRRSALLKPRLSQLENLVRHYYLEAWQWHWNWELVDAFVVSGLSLGPGLTPLSDPLPIPALSLENRSLDVPPDTSADTPPEKTAEIPSPQSEKPSATAPLFTIDELNRELTAKLASPPETSPVKSIRYQLQILCLIAQVPISAEDRQLLRQQFLTILRQTTDIEALNLLLNSLRQTEI